MNKQDKYDEDLLSRYINPEGIEKAPEGFTTNVMSLIKTENEPVKAEARPRKRSLVPVISGAVTVLLIVLVFLMPDNKSDLMTLPSLEFLKNITATLPEIDLISLFSSNIPVTLIYGLLGILILSLLDRALYGVFHKEK
jgi:hypothetical protein